MNAKAAKVLWFVSGRRREVEEVYREIGGAEKKISRGDMVGAKGWDRQYVTATMCGMDDWE